MRLRWEFGVLGQALTKRLWGGADGTSSLPWSERPSWDFSAVGKRHLGTVSAGDWRSSEANASANREVKARCPHQTYQREINLMPNDRRAFLKNVGGLTAAVVATSNLTREAAAESPIDSEAASAGTALQRPPGRVQIGLFLDGE